MVSWPLTILVDRTKCTGLGICESLADDYFELDDEGELVLIAGTEVSADDEARVRAAVAGCPVRALELG